VGPEGGRNVRKGGGRVFEEHHAEAADGEIELLGREGMDLRVRLREPRVPEAVGAGPTLGFPEHRR